MKSRWYIGALIVLLTLIGAASQQSSTVPNQEIVLEFANIEITPNETESIIAVVKQQLLDLGVSNIQVSPKELGKLSITYYSEADVKSIKDILSKGSGVVIDFNSNKKDNKSNNIPFGDDVSYQLDVYEIQKQHNPESGLGDKCVLEFKLKSDRYYFPNIYAPFNNSQIRAKDFSTIVAYKVRKKINLAIDDLSRSIPEVRAGPYLQNLV